MAKNKDMVTELESEVNTSDELEQLKKQLEEALKMNAELAEANKAKEKEAQDAQAALVKAENAKRDSHQHVTAPAEQNRMAEQLKDAVEIIPLATEPYTCAGVLYYLVRGKSILVPKELAARLIRAKAARRAADVYDELEI